MRTTRSSFVVEYKTGRRQTKPGGSSIWGNLDLQAVARAVEADSGGATERESQSPVVPEMIAGTEPSVIAMQGQPLAEDLSDNSAAEPLTNEGPANAVVDEVPSASQRTSKPAAKLVLRGRRPAKVLKGSVVSDDSERSALNEPLDELATLEADNRYLKSLMVAKLQEENARLRSMLRRFETAHQS